MSRTTETSDLGQTHDYNVTKDRNWTKEKAAATKSTYPVIASGSEISGTLKGKWRGTDQDQHDMFSLGRIQELRVSSSPQNDLLLLCSLFVNALAELFLLVYDGLHSDASLYLGNHPYPPELRSCGRRNCRAALGLRCRWNRFPPSLF